MRIGHGMVALVLMALALVAYAETAATPPAGFAEPALPEVEIQVDTYDVPRARPLDPSVPEVIEAAGGARSVKEFYASGRVRTVSRYDRDGRLMAILHRTDDGVATHADLFEGGRLAGRLHYRPGGAPRLEERFDAAGATTWSKRY